MGATSRLRNSQTRFHAYDSAIALRDLARSIPPLAMKRRIPRDRYGIPHKRKFLGGGVETAFGLCDSDAEGGERLDLRLERMRHALSDFFGQMVQYGWLVHGAVFFGFAMLQSRSDRFRDSAFS